MITKHDHNTHDHVQIIDCARLRTILRTRLPRTKWVNKKSMYVETPVSTHALHENQAYARNWSFALHLIYMGETRFFEKTWFLCLLSEITAGSRSIPDSTSTVLLCQAVH